MIDLLTEARHRPRRHQQQRTGERCSDRSMAVVASPPVGGHPVLEPRPATVIQGLTVTFSFATTEHAATLHDREDHGELRRGGRFAFPCSPSW
jgi:hypothetical protein